MKEKKSNLTWRDAPDIISPLELADILGIGENKAREIFNRKDFPKIRGIGVKQLADKQAVRLWTMQIDITPEILKQIISQLQIKNQISTNRAGCLIHNKI